ncbi:NAD-dependent epimerase/dehydratase family protein [Nitrospira sp. Nam74]
MKQSYHHKTLLITGANGFIGAQLAIAAFARGYLVKTLSRSTPSIPSCIPNEHRYAGNLPGSIPPQALENVNSIAHCAAWVKSGWEMAQAVNVDGTLKLAEMALRQKVETFIFISSQSARADATSDYGRSKYLAEQTLLSRFSNTGLKIIILRPGLVTGHGHQGLYRRLCRMVDSWPFLPLLHSAKTIVQAIHIDDLCNAVLRCDQIAHQLNGRILKLGHPHGALLVEFLQELALARGGHKKLVVTVPMWPIAALVSTAEHLGLSLPITSVNLKGLTTVERMDTATDMALLGIPVRSLDILVRDHMAHDPAILRDAALISRYLLHITASPELQYRYASAIQRLNIRFDRDEDRLWRIIERYPRTLRMIDGGLAFLQPQGGIRRKIYTMLAILEASPEHCDHFLPKTCTRFQRIRLFGIGLRAGLTTLLGLLFIQMVKVKSK